MLNRPRLIGLDMLILLAVGLLAGCQFPMTEPSVDRNATAAAETIAAQLTALVVTSGPVIPTTAAPPPTIPIIDTPTPTATLTPTATFTATPTTVPCDRAQFVSDVNYPDGTDVQPGLHFTKTWRLRNTGSCTWTSSYALVFDHGAAMGAAAAVPLTSGSVASGGTVDVSIDLTAPSTPGTYQGYFKLRNASGVLFGIGAAADQAFWVKIDVVPTSTTATLTWLSAEGGSVRSGGGVLAGVPNVGDTPDNQSSQAFMSFDISGIPAGSTITGVTFDLSHYDTLGNPFADLGCLYVYKQDYGSLDAGDFTPGSPSGGLIRLCGAASLGSSVADDDFITAVQSKVGSSRFQVRWQFTDTSVSSDGEADMVRFGLPGQPITMTVTYYTAP